MTKSITNCDSIIDSRDVESRIEELKSELEFDLDDADSVKKMIGIDIDTVDELASLLKFKADAEYSTNEWIHGACFINDDYFETYARELADDIGAIDRNAKWPLSHIDWAAAAEELKMDYSAVDFGGTTFWVRS